MADTTAIDAADAASQVLGNAFTQLRQLYPFMNTEHLSAILARMNDNLHAELIASEPAMANSKARFNFFKLPAELRSYIYELALARDASDYFKTQRAPAKNYWGRYIPQVKPSKMPPLGQVCKQVRAEALSIFFASTHFVATFATRDLSPALVPEWLDIFGQDLIKNVKHLTIKFPDSDQHSVVGHTIELATSPGYRNSLAVKRLTNRKSRAILKSDVVDVLRLQDYGVDYDAVVVTYQDWTERDWRVLEEEV